MSEYSQIYVFMTGFFAGLALACFFYFVLAKKYQKNLAQKIADFEHEKIHLSTLLAVANEREQNKLEFYEKRVLDLAQVHDNMREAFAAISRDSLIKNADMMNMSFKQSMEHFFKASERERLQTSGNLKDVISPLKESLISIDKKVMELETERKVAYTGLVEQISGLLHSQTTLHVETKNLSRALNAPGIRGRWGEMQLRRVVELSGLSDHCDFIEQKTVRDGDDVFRPDMIITLPANKKIIIDAKVPLDWFDQGESLEKADKSRSEISAALRRHLAGLKKKNYHKILNDTPEFIVMFLPGESFLAKALKADPDLLDYAAQNDIIIATPITLVALLKAIAFGFRQEAVANNIEEVRRLAQELIDRIHKVSEHFEKLGKNLRQATESYNQTLSSLDSRVLVTARKLCELKSMSNKKAEVLDPKNTFIDLVPYEVTFKPVCDGDA